MRSPVQTLVSILCAVACIACSSAAPADPAREVAPVRWERFNMAPLDGAGMETLCKLIANSNRYALNTWYSEVKRFGSQDGDYLEFGGTTEHFIRPVSHQAFSLAVSLRWGIYQPDVTGVPVADARQRTVRMISSLAFRHKSNNPNVKGWGDAWQSALWASQTALAAWFLWDDLDPRDRELVTNMLIHEADRFNEYNAPYYRNKEGRIIFKGDSKAEENAWNSNILATACAMLPRHRNWECWMAKATELQISAFSAPGDWNKKAVINGFDLSTLQGSNIESDGTVINHHIIHPDYMSAVMHNVINGWILALAGQPVPRASVYNGELIYRAITRLEFDKGKTIYIREGKKPTSRMYYPQGNDWGEYRQANYWLLDLMASFYGWDAGDTIKAGQWAAEREQTMARMQARSRTGQYYQSPGEDLFRSREEWVSFHLAYGYLGLWEHANGMLRLTDRPLNVPAAADRKSLPARSKQ